MTNIKYTKTFKNGIFLVDSIGANFARIAIANPKSTNIEFANLSSEEVDTLLMTLIELKAAMLGMKDVVKVADLLIDVGKALGLSPKRMDDVRNQFLEKSMEENT